MIVLFVKNYHLITLVLIHCSFVKYIYHYIIIRTIFTHPRSSACVRAHTVLTNSQKKKKERTNERKKKKESNIFGLIDEGR